jgi:hypothetical protein
MSAKEQKIFSTAREVIETYFPLYARKKQESSSEKQERVVDDLAVELAEQFKVNLQRQLRSRSSR